ncbi:hypothetical protein Q9L42_008055 [Methylomarinum sp. Ch1-1]|uniref:Uncharacterized protein n=1 Tax=Methylomarinum roseum TaxID=3067653 RepID=A0AAU7NYN7_9GAMM|nr:hypothetical protein [Methylomarinum sp. Ch1-1]MDP4521824.1 hypothetical protein [Methylomarinum sp. Ch1-1]
MIGSVVAAFVAIWFYHTAKQTGRQPISWAVAGIVVYFMVALMWTNFVTPPIKDAASHSQNGFLIFLTRYAYIMVGLACAVFFNLKFAGSKERD